MNTLFNLTVIFIVASFATSSHGNLVNKVLQSMTGGMYGPGYNQQHAMMNGLHGQPVHGGHYRPGMGPIGGHLGGPMGHIGGPVVGHMGGPVVGHMGPPVVGHVGPNVHSGGKPEPKFGGGGRDYYGFRNPRAQG